MRLTNEFECLLLNVYVFAFCVLIIGFSRTENKPQEKQDAIHLCYCFKDFWAMINFKGANKACLFNSSF